MKLTGEEAATHTKVTMTPLNGLLKPQLTYLLLSCTLEFFLHREGQISREEITSYFMRGMSICAKLGYNFNDAHNFHETTYKRPTFCNTCGGFVSTYGFGFDMIY